MISEGSSAGGRRPRCKIKVGSNKKNYKYTRRR